MYGYILAGCIGFSIGTAVASIVVWLRHRKLVALVEYIRKVEDGDDTDCDARFKAPILQKHIDEDAEYDGE